MKIINKIASSQLLLLLASPIFAATDTTEEPPRLEEGIDGILDKILGYILPFAGLVCVVFIIIGGYMWITSAGDPSKVKQAQGTLTWAIIGLVFIIMSVAILSAIKNFIS